MGTENKRDEIFQEILSGYERNLMRKSILRRFLAKFLAGLDLGSGGLGKFPKVWVLIPLISPTPAVIAS